MQVGKVYTMWYVCFRGFLETENTYSRESGAIWWGLGIDNALLRLVFGTVGFSSERVARDRSSHRHIIMIRAVALAEKPPILFIQMQEKLMEYFPFRQNW